MTQRISAGGHGDLDVFPVDAERRRRGADRLALERCQPVRAGVDQARSADDLERERGDRAASSVSSYQLTENNTLVPVGPAEVPSPGLACWNVITDNGKFLYVTNPSGPFVGGASITAYTIGRDGSLASAGPGVNVPAQSGLPSQCHRRGVEPGQPVSVRACEPDAALPGTVVDNQPVLDRPEDWCDSRSSARSRCRATTPPDSRPGSPELKRAGGSSRREPPPAPRNAALGRRKNG